MKKIITLAICCMMLVQLHAQQNPTLESPSQENNPIEVIQDLDIISERDTDAAEQTSESQPSEKMNTAPVVQTDSTEPPIPQEVETTTSDQDSEQENSNNEGEGIFIVELDDFQTIQATQRKQTFLSILSSLFKKRKKRNTKQVIKTSII